MLRALVGGRPMLIMTNHEEHINLSAQIAQAEKDEALAKKCTNRRIIAYLDQLDGTNNDDIKSVHDQIPKIFFAAISPGEPVIPPPGCVPDPH